MKHLTEEQISALLDDALPAPERTACDEHLAGCEACRARLAEFTELDASLGRVLTHDPGEAYFADFAERVSARIAAESGTAVAAASEAAPRKRSAWDWFLSPRGLALAGSTAALVLVAGVAWMRFRSQDDVASALRESAPSTQSLRVEDQAAPAGPAPALPTETATAPPTETAPTPTGTAPTPAATIPAPVGAMRAREAQLETGTKEQAPPKSPPAAGAGARLEQREKQEPARSLAAEMKRRSLQPAQEKVAARDELAKSSEATTPPAPAASAFREDAPTAARAQANVMRQSLDVANEIASPCGTVHDTRGQPIAAAQIVALGKSAHTARTGKDGRFCLPSLEAGDTLSVLRVGYEPMRIVVGPATSLALQIEPVGTLGREEGGLLAARSKEAPPSLTEGDDAAKLGFTRRTPSFAQIAPAADVYASQPAVIRLAVVDARKATDQARRERTAASYERAADRWERIGSMASGKAGIDARLQGLAALREAHRLEPAAVRANRLRARLITFLETVPDSLPEHTTARRWQVELGDR